MDTQWRDDQPIYLQLQERIKRMILDGSLAEGEALPSVRKVAAQFQVNPMTVMKSYQALVDDGLVEKRRGRGMFCTEGARARLMEQEKLHFISEEWPRIVDQMRRLGIEPEQLLGALSKENKE
ncbi:GntR family transcriptional regulator [Thiolapillus sp.]